MCLLSPVTRTKCVSVLSYLSRVDLRPILPLLPHLQRMAREDHWELKGQLLILCANALLFFNTQAEESAAEDRIVETSEEQSRQQSVSRRAPAVSAQEAEGFTPLLFDVI